MTFETIIILGLLIAGLLVVGRFLFALLSVVFLAFLILLGLALASDILTGGHALQELANQLAPVVATWFAGIALWLKQRTAGSS